MPKIDWEELTYETKLTNALQEWPKKYQGTYVWLNKKHLLFVNNIDGHFLHFTDMFGGNIKTRFDTENTIDVSFPNVGLFQMDKNFGYFTKVPARQYKKAPCSNNCTIIAPSAEGANLGADFELLLYAFEGKTIPLPVARSQLEKKEIESAAITHKWGLSRHPAEEKTTVLWYLEYPVAELKDSVFTTKVPSFQQEILDFVRDMKYNMEVV